MKKSMTSKERVKAALNHEEPDRVPSGYASANADIDRRMKSHFNLAADDNDGLMAALQIDTRGVGAAYTGPCIHPEVDGLQVNPLWGIHTRWIENESGGYWDYCDFPLKDATLEVVEAWPMPSVDDFDYAGIPLMCEKYKDYFVIYGHAGVCDIINTTGMLRTMQQVLIDLALEDAAGLRIFERKCATELGMMERVLESAKGGIDMIWIGEDLGTQTGPLISLEMYRKLLRPQHQKFIDLAKSFNVPVMIHSCGSSSWAFDDFIDMGITVVDTLQPEAAKMSPTYLKETYGDKLCFHGCISTAGPMAYGTVQETIDSVKETLEVMKPGGGYILSPTHLIQDNSPTENVVAVYETVLKHGKYQN